MVDVENSMTGDNLKNKKSGELTRQLLFSFVINLVSFLQGASVSTSSIILHGLQEENGDNKTFAYERVREDMVVVAVYDDLRISEEEGSWIASSWVLGHMVSACLAGGLSDAVGRKTSLMIDIIVFLFGFLLLSVSNSVSSLVVARFLLGCPLVSQIFVCEVLPPHKRGLGGAMYSTLHSTGFFLVLILGAYLPWRWAVAVPAILSVPIFVAVTFLHESPEWLNKKGQVHKCQAALEFYKKDLEEEAFKQIVNKENKESERKHSVHPKRLIENLKIVLKQYPSFPGHLAFLITLFLCIGWCGFSILSFYAVEIFQLSGSPLSASNTSWITSTTKIICSILAFYALHRMNRNILFLLTGVLVFLAFLVMGIFTYLSFSMVLLPELLLKVNFIPMLCVILAYVGYGLGYNIVPGILAAELTPVEIRSTTVGILMMVEMSSTFVLSKLKPKLIDILGIHGLFLMFAVTVFLVIVLTVLMMMKKEKNKVSQQLQA